MRKVLDLEHPAHTVRTSRIDKYFFMAVSLLHGRRILDQTEPFLENEGERRVVVTETAGILEGVFLSDLQPSHQGGHLFHPADTIRHRAVFFINPVPDDVTIDSSITDNSSIMNDRTA